MDCNLDKAKRGSAQHFDTNANRDEQSKEEVRVVADILASREEIVMVKIVAVPGPKDAREIAMAESPTSATMMRSLNL